MTKYIRHFVSLVPLSILTLFTLLISTIPLYAEDYQIQVTVDPQRVNFDANAPNRVTVRVEVRDATGNPAPDMTTVRFSTTLGTIPAVTNTQNGQTVAVLENTQGPGKATVTVTVGGSQQVRYVEFLGPGEKASASTTKRLSYRLSAKQGYYSARKETFDLRDTAKFVTPDFTITAEAIQYDDAQKIITAQQSVTVTDGTHTFTAERLRLDLSLRAGALIEVEPNICYKTFTLATMTPEESENAKTIDFTPLSALPTRTWILFSEATVFPGDQIQFHHPEFYVDKINHCLLRLPYHVLDLRSSSYGMFLNSEVNLTSDGGLNVDFPVYYAASADHIGSLHLRNVAEGSPYYRDKAGFQLGVQEEYLLGNHGDGALYLDDLTRTRGVSWQHKQEFGKTVVDVNASYDRYSMDSPYSTGTNMTLSRTLGQTGVFLSSSWNALSGDQSSFVEMSLAPPSFPLGKSKFSLNFSPYFGFNWNKIAARTIEGDGYDQPESTNSLFNEGLRTSLSIPIVKNLIGGTLNTSLSNDLSHNSNGLINNYLGASVRYQRPLFLGFTSSLGYSFGLNNSNQDGVDSRLSQYLNFDLNGNGTYWYLSTYSSYNIVDESLYGSLSCTYQLPNLFAKDKNRERKWAMAYGTNFNSNKYTSFTTDQQFTLSRKLGDYTVLVHYSPTGNTAVTGFGTGTGKKWAFEIIQPAW